MRQSFRVELKEEPRILQIPTSHVLGAPCTLAEDIDSKAAPISHRFALAAVESDQALEGKDSLSSRHLMGLWAHGAVSLVLQLQVIANVVEVFLSCCLPPVYPRLLLRELRHELPQFSAFEMVHHCPSLTSPFTEASTHKNAPSSHQPAPVATAMLKTLTLTL